MLVHRLVLAMLFGFATTTYANPITITTFNIKFYGKYKSTILADERDTTIQEFLQVSGIDSDVIAFQEILDTQSLGRNVLPDCTRRTNQRSFVVNVSAVSVRRLTRRIRLT